MTGLGVYHHQKQEIGRGREIRTPDPLLPKQMRYQAALCPDISFKKHPLPVRRWDDTRRPIRRQLFHLGAPEGAIVYWIPAFAGMTAEVIPV